MLNVNDTRNAHSKARNSTETLCFPSLSFGSSCGRRGVVSSMAAVGLITCVTAILTSAWNCEGKAWCWEKSYRDAQGELTNALRKLHPGIGGIAATRISRNPSPHRHYEVGNVACLSQRKAARFKSSRSGVAVD